MPNENSINPNIFLEAPNEPQPTSGNGFFSALSEYWRRLNTDTNARLNQQRRIERQSTAGVAGKPGEGPWYQSIPRNVLSSEPVQRFLNEGLMTLGPRAPARLPQQKPFFGRLNVPETTPTVTLPESRMTVDQLRSNFGRSANQNVHPSFRTDEFQYMAAMDRQNAARSRLQEHPFEVIEGGPNARPSMHQRALDQLNELRRQVGDPPIGMEEYLRLQRFYDSELPGGTHRPHDPILSTLEHEGPDTLKGPAEVRNFRVNQAQERLDALNRHNDQLTHDLTRLAFERVANPSNQQLIDATAQVRQELARIRSNIQKEKDIITRSSGTHAPHTGPLYTRLLDEQGSRFSSGSPELYGSRRFPGRVPPLRAGNPVNTANRYFENNPEVLNLVRQMEAQNYTPNHIAMVLRRDHGVTMREDTLTNYIYSYRRGQRGLLKGPRDDVINAPNRVTTDQIVEWLNRSNVPNLVNTARGGTQYINAIDPHSRGSVRVQIRVPTDEHIGVPEGPTHVGSRFDTGTRLVSNRHREDPRFTRNVSGESYSDPQTLFDALRHRLSVDPSGQFLTSPGREPAYSGVRPGTRGFYPNNRSRNIGQTFDDLAGQGQQSFIPELLGRRGSNTKGLSGPPRQYTDLLPRMTEMYGQGTSIPRIANELGVSRNTVTNMLRESGVTIRGTAIRHPALSDPSVTQAIDSMVARGWNSNEIAFNINRDFNPARRIAPEVITRYRQRNVGSLVDEITDRAKK